VHKLLVRGGKLFVAIAATWAVGASLYIFSWYEARGLWGILWLVLFSGLYLLAVRAAWRGNDIALAIMSVTAVALSIVTGFSIGGAYLPAALGLFIGALMFLSSRLLRTQC